MISVTILTKNNQQTLTATLASLRSFPEIIIYDTGSIDDTLTLASQFENVIIHRGFFEGFGKTHNNASSLATHDWILSIDSDEILSPSLNHEILQLQLQSHCIYEISRHNFFNGKWIKGCGGWYPDRVVRLYHRKITRFSENLVHESVIPINLTTISLTAPLYHTPYRSIADFLEKLQKYTTLFAEQQTQKKASIWKAILHGWFAFFKSFVLKKGFLNGREGFIISAYNGHTAFYKYLKLMERCNLKDREFDKNLP